MSYDTREDVASKIEWEGCIYTWVNGYGMNPDDMPDEELKEAAVKMKAHLDIAQYYIDRFAGMLPEVDENS